MLQAKDNSAVYRTQGLNGGSENPVVERNSDRKTRTAIRNRISAQKSRDRRNARIQCLADANAILSENSKKVWLERMFLQQRIVQYQEAFRFIDRRE